MRCTIDDLEKIDRILKDDAVYPFIEDDGSPQKELFTAKPFLENTNFHVLMPNNQTAILVYPVNYITYDFHIAVLKEGRGQMAVDAAKRALKEYIFNKTPCLKIIIQVPAFNRGMIRFARNLGARIEGVLKNSFLKSGKLHDQLIFSLSKE